MKPRIQFEAEILNKGNYLFVVPAEYDKDVIVKKWKDVFGEFFKTFSEKLNSINTWDAASIESILKSTAVEAGIKPGELLQLFRVMISGQSGGVDLFGMCALLGREELQLRIDLALQNIASKSN
jgi:glutamyl-tRNA synthetase